MIESRLYVVHITLQVLATHCLAYICWDHIMLFFLMSYGKRPCFKFFSFELMIENERVIEVSSALRHVQ
jgi:hypothetical protein